MTKEILTEIGLGKRTLYYISPGEVFCGVIVEQSRLERDYAVALRFISPLLGWGAAYETCFPTSLFSLLYLHEA